MYSYTIRLHLWLLIIILFRSTSYGLYEEDAPRTFWADDSCNKGKKFLTQRAIQQSLNAAKSGAYRLINKNDKYQPKMFNLLIQQAVDFSDYDNPVWVAIRKYLPNIPFEM